MGDKQAMPLLNRPLRVGLTKAGLQGGAAPVDPLKKCVHFLIKDEEQMPTETARSIKKRSEQRNKTKTIGVRVTPTEYEKIKSKAQKLDMSMSAFLLTLALQSDTPEEGLSSSLDRATLTKVLGQLGKVGSNLNQIAKRMHLGGNVGVDKVLLTCKHVIFLKNEILKTIRGEDGH